MAKSRIELTFAEAMDLIVKGLDLKLDGDVEIKVIANYANSLLSGVTIEINPTTDKT